jgi:hypothetical protein
MNQIISSDYESIQLFDMLNFKILRECTLSKQKHGATLSKNITFFPINNIPSANLREIWNYQSL